MPVKLLVRVKGGPGSGNWGHAGRPGLRGGSGGRGAGAIVTNSIKRQRDNELMSMELKTYVDHGPPGYTPGRSTITRQDRNALVFVDDLLDPRKVDVVRTAGRETSRPVGYIRKMADDMREHGYDPTSVVTIGVEQDGSITLIDGTHRVRAAQLAGYRVVPSTVRYFGGSDVDHMLSYYNG